MQTPFWLNEPTILVKAKYINHLWPTKDMDVNEKLNSITRLVLLLSLILYLITNNNRIIITCCIIIFAIILLKYTLKQEKEGFKLNKNDVLVPSELQFPTPSNPMMNVMLPQIQDNPNRPPAASSYNPTIVDKINETTQTMVVNTFDNPDGINDRLFKDLGDSFQFDRSMIQFNSNANTQIPNDQKSFAEFCYGDMISCKEGDPMACSKRMPPNWI
jgi:hypothetical protein